MTRILLVDCGNTCTKLCLLHAGVRGTVQTLPTEPSTIGQWLKRNLPGTETIYCSNVVQAISPIFEESARIAGCRLTLVGMESPFSFSIPDRCKTGIDRLVAIEGALARAAAPVVVVSLGTAITVSSVDRNGTFVGGCIAPGCGLSVEALYKKAPALTRISPTANSHLLNLETSDALAGGIFVGFIGMIERLIGDTVEELADEDRPTIFLTGGDLPLFDGHLTSVDVYDLSLTLNGLTVLSAKECS